MATVALRDQKVLKIRVEHNELREKVNRLGSLFLDLERCRVHLLYANLKPGGVLAKAVKDFTFFPDFECNDAFLELLNFTDSCEPREGLYKNFVCYHTVDVAQHRKYQQQADTVVGKAGPGASANNMNIGSGIGNNAGDNDAGTNLVSIIDKADSARMGRKRKLNWKTKWLVYNCYVRCNTSMKHISALFGISNISVTLVHNIVYAWANTLCVMLAKFFLVPTRSKMLRAYLKSVIKTFGRANIFMLLDATELRPEVVSMKTVSAIL